VGSKGSKARKPSHSQHLPKVGTATENRRLQRAERHAVGEQLGGTGMPAGFAIGLVLVIAAAFALVIFLLVHI
jgi:hypothetical protein